MDYAHITRTDTVGSTSAPAILPKAGYLVANYGFLVGRGERVRLDEFADRMEAHYDNVRVSIEAGEIRRWYELMVYAEDTVVNFGAIPCEFEYLDGLYNAEDVWKILGQDAINYLLADDAA
ncbi:MULTISPECIES: hypothetical protein [Marinobacter]|uniref:Uncharacterized protein n=1 Tax=Marinobacter nauticus (strain ATCC 700491 / DSM 11845 / VT8) TaxID=351348 RepID=A1U846_MARN8|nr:MULTISPECIES: hypothetical protein [Marinobacter]ABM21165.1 hypothetical protein Maqu_4314 [Marinobacter nauticus VT8]